MITKKVKKLVIILYIIILGAIIPNTVNAYDLKNRAALIKAENLGKTIRMCQATNYWENGSINYDIICQCRDADNVYCVEHTNGTVDDMEEFTVKAYARIEGDLAYNSKTSNDSPIQNEKNLALAYLLIKENYPFGYNPENMVRTRAIHRYLCKDGWHSDVGKSLNSNLASWVTSWAGEDYDTYEASASLITNAETFAGKAENKAAYVTTSKPTVTITENKNWNNTGNPLIGPFNISFNGTLDTLDVIFTDNTRISASNSKIIIRQSSDTKNISQIKSGTDFYLVNGTGKVIKSVVAKSKNNVLKAELWFLQYNNYVQKYMLAETGTVTKNSSECIINVKYRGTITFQKIDKDDSTPIRNVGFKIKSNTDNKWFNGTKFVSEENAQIYTSNSNGIVTVNNLPSGRNYTIYEVSAPNSLGYYLEAQSGYDGGKINLGEVRISATNLNRTVGPFTNYKTGNLNIYKKDLDATSNVGRTGAGFKIKTSAGSDTWLSGTKAPYIYNSTYANATTYYIKDKIYGSNDTVLRYNNPKHPEYGTGITIKYLRYGTYSLYEVAPPTGYLLRHQDGIKMNRVASGNAVYDVSNNRVNTNISVTIPTDTSRIVSNVQKISISGRVWEEGIPDKGSYANYNSIYDSNIDHNLGGITVKLIKKGETRATGTTTTNSDGTYLFDSLIKKSELKDYYVEFDYSSKNSGNTRYIPVEFNKNETNGSKALAYTIPTNDMDVTGIATTYAGTNTNQIATYGLENIGTLNSSTLTLGNINLGIKPLLDPDYGLRQNLAYLKLNIKGYTYIYQYGGTQDADNFVPIGQNGPTAKWQNSDSIYGYSRQFYPSDIIYDRESSKQELEATVVYRIDVTNTVGENTKELYQQPDTLHLISVENRYDTNRYTLISDEIWEDKNNSGTAIMNSTAINKMNNGTAGIASENTSTEYIQFRVKKDAITKILENPRGIIEEFPTTVKTSAYHNYYRDDYMWQNLGKTGTNISGVKSTNNLHRTRNREKEEKAPYLVFSIDEQRTISGKVFKDKIVTNNGEKLGNGIYDSDEKGVEGVKVELLDIGGEKLTLSHLYQAKVIEEENKTITEIKDAVVTTNDRGEYSLEGVVPGRYYLGFIYGNGNYKITKLNGEVVEEGKLSTKIEGKEVTAKEYKSTIIKSKIVKDVIGFVEKTIASMTEEQRQAYEKQLIEDTYTWYKKDEFIQGKYSVAIDDLKVRKELNESKENLNAQALSPQISITIENTKDNNAQEKVISNDSNETVKNASGTESNVGILNDKKENVKNKFEGFYFGIIEQPRQEAEIEKVITNVKLTNAQGNVLYDGNPENVPSQGMVSISDLDNTENGGSTYVRAEIIEDSIYGSNLELTYEVRVKNISDINYYNEDYYKYGDKNPNKEVTLTPANVSDYLDKTLKYDENKSDALRIKEENPNQLETITVNTKNIEAQQFNLEGWKTLYTNQNKEREDETTKDKVVLVANRKLSKDNDDMEITSRAEIKEIVHTPDPADTETSNEEKTEQIKVAPKEVHTNGMVKATMTITPPTGAFANDTILYATVGIISLILLSAGIVIIKKKIV